MTLSRRRIRWFAVAAVLVVAVLVVTLMVRDRGDQPAPPAATSTSSLLALTWAPSLCRVEPGASGCRSGRVASRGGALLLHGLWPQPASQRYCNVDPPPRGARPPVALPEDLQARLNATMSDAAVAAPYQWYVHGTCSGLSPADYFRIAAGLAEQATAALDPMIAALSGREVTARGVRATIDGRFGAGAGARVALSCRGDGRGGAVLYEVRLSLPAVADLRGDDDLRAALVRGPVIPPGCGRARVP